MVHPIFNSNARTRRHRPVHQEVQTESVEPFFQPKLSINQPGDPYEREADTVADQVVNQNRQGTSLQGNQAIQRRPISSIQRLSTPDEEKMPSTNDARMAEDKQIQEKPEIQRAEAPKEEENPVQKAEMKEEEPVQKAEKEEEAPLQKMDTPKEEEPVQKAEKEEEPVQKAEKEEEVPIQKMDAPKEEEPLQKAEKEEESVQKMDASKEEENPVQKAEMKEEEPVQKAEQKEEEKGAATGVQTKSKSNNPTQASPDFSTRLSSRRGQGEPLPAATRTQMEQGIGADFSQVRIHADSEAAQMSDDIQAQAFTNGKDVYFNAGKYDTSSTEGQRLLAHELTHVVQQGKEVKRQVQSTDEERTRYVRQLQGSESTPHQSRVAQALQQLERNAADPNFQMNEENRAAISLLRSMYDSGQIEFWETSNSGTAAAAFHRVPNHHVRLHVVEHGATATSGFTLLHEAIHALHSQQFPGIDRLYLDDANGRLSTNRRRDFLRWRAYTEYWARRRVIEYQRDPQGPYSQSELHREVMRFSEVRTLVAEARALDPDFNPYTWSPPSRYGQRRT